LKINYAYLKSKIKFYLYSEVAQNIFKLTFGSVVSQSIILLSYPIISRLYVQEDFGIYSLTISFAVFLSAFSTLSFETALVVADEEDYKTLLLLNALLSLFIFMISILFFISIGNVLSQVLNINHSFSFYFVASLGGLFYACYLIINNCFNRLKLYKELSFFRIIQSFSFVLFSIFFYFFNKTILSLSYSFILSFLTADLFAFYILKKNIKFNFNLSQIKTLARIAIKYKSFPYYQFPGVLLNNIKENGSTIFISWLFSPIVLGNYSFSLRVLRMPLNFIGFAIGQVLFKRFDEIKRKSGDLQKTFKRAIIFLSTLSFPFFFILFFWGDKIFIFIFGSKWGIAGYYSQIFSPWLFINFIASSLSLLPAVVDKQKQFFYLSTIYNLTFPIILYLSSKIFVNPEHSFLVLSIYSFLWGAGVLRFFWKIAK